MLALHLPRSLVFPALIAAIAAPGTVARAQDHQHNAAAETIGRVAFSTSCAPAAQPNFERAVAMLHSFWFERAKAAFDSVAAADPSCAMAHWGVAMTQWGNPFIRQAIPEERMKSGLAAAERAVELAAAQSAREQAYAAAALVLYRDAASKDHLARMREHERALRDLVARYPDDREGTIFLARAMVATADPADLTFANQLAAAASLEPVFVAQPDHPGLAHYLIHAYDAPALAGKGLGAARRYAEIAPSAPHALHMPSHIFTRLGYWQESIDANRRSASAEPVPNAAVHPLDYMVYAFLQLGRDSAASEVVGRASQNADTYYRGILGYNFAAMPARMALERGRWADAAQLAVPANTAPFVEAVPRFARAVGAARSGRLAQAREELAALERLGGALKESGDTYWGTIVEAQRLAAAAWIARAQRKNAEALRLARAGAELEESVEKHPVTPGPLLPARELEADLLFDLGRYGAAQRAYERVLTREPNRARSLFGAARAAEKASNRSAARKRYQEVLSLMASADAARPEPAAAKRYLARR